MDDGDKKRRRQAAIIKDVCGHLMEAQKLMDAVEPFSIIAARLQQLIDALDDEATAPVGD